MKTLSRKESFAASPSEVFPVLDDLGVTGTHMTQSSAMMMSNKLHLEHLTPNHTGLNSSYRWTGKMMGMKMDFTVRVTKWGSPKTKVWETIGQTKLIIYSWYRMVLNLVKTSTGTEVELSISYEKPDTLWGRILCFLFADWYCRWCLRKMLLDGKRIIENKKP